VFSFLCFKGVANVEGLSGGIKNDVAEVDEMSEGN